MAMAAKDDMIDLFRERFSGHELEVPSGTWQAISGQLAADAQAEGLREMLQDKFEGHTVDVDPGVWQGISGQLGHGAAAGAAGGAGAWGWVAAAAGAIAITAAVLYATRSTVTEQPVAVLPATEQPLVPPPMREEALPMTAPEAVQEEELSPATPAERTAVKAQPSVAAASTGTPSTTQAPGEEEQGMEVVRRILRELEQNTAPVELPRREPAPPAPPQTMLRDTSPAQHATGGTEPVTKPGSMDPSPTPANSVKKESDPTIMIPNIFTPNNDGVNDQLIVSGRDYDRVVVKIFSGRTNALVFQSDRLAHTWDGRLPDGQPAENGLYFYACEVFTKDGNVIPKVQVIRLER